MTAPETRLSVQYILEPVLGNQRLAGTVSLRIWGQSLDVARPATWAAAIRVVSEDASSERGVLLPLTIGDQPFGPDFAPLMIGPLNLQAVDAREGDRIVIELGSRGAARIEGRDDNQAWVQFSADFLYKDLRHHFTTIRTSRLIGKCIYCGSVEPTLGREHIIAEGLNGDITLTQASCRKHEQVTSLFETKVLKDMFGTARVALQMRSKRPEKRPPTLPILVKDGERDVELQIPIEDYPVIFCFPVFLEPGHLCSRPYSRGITSTAEPAFIHVAGLTIPELKRKYGNGAFLRQLQPQHEFARMLAKIGLGFSVLHFGADHFAETYVLPALLGERDEIGHWVGCKSGRGSEKPESALHAIELQVVGKEVHVLIRLFAQFGAPLYQVVVGRLR